MHLFGYTSVGLLSLLIANNGRKVPLIDVKAFEVRTLSSKRRSKRLQVK
jgi:hypothetical protein